MTGKTMAFAGGLFVAVTGLLAGMALLTGCEHGMPGCAMHAGKGGHCDPPADGARGTTAQAAPSPGPSVADRVVNSRCPIMGGRVDPDRVAANLTRDFDGRKVGFCCAGCPEQWDGLTAGDRSARLAKVAAP